MHFLPTSTHQCFPYQKHKQKKHQPRRSPEAGHRASLRRKAFQPKAHLKLNIRWSSNSPCCVLLVFNVFDADPLAFFSISFLFCSSKFVCKSSQKASFFLFWSQLRVQYFFTAHGEIYAIRCTFGLFGEYFGKKPPLTPRRIPHPSRPRQTKRGV